MSRKRGKHRSGSSSSGRRFNAWTVVWVIIAVLLVIGIALRRAPVQGEPPLTAAAVAAEPASEAANADDGEIQQWLDALRRPDRRDAFLEAAEQIEPRWHDHPQVQPIVEELLTLPQYSASAVWRFVGQDLLRADFDDEPRIQQLARSFGQFGGEGYPAGLRIELTAYIERTHPNATRDHRRALEIIGQAELTEPADDAEVRVTAVEQHTVAQLVDLLPGDLEGVAERAMADMLDDMAGLTHDVYHPIDRAIGETHDYLALACARYLWDREEHEPRIRRYLENRLDRSERYGAAIRRMLNKLNEAR